MTQPNPRAPRIYPDTAAFWDACRRHELRLQRCGDCNRWHHFPRTLCPECWSANVVPTPVCGRGTVAMFTRTGPHAVAWIDLDEQEDLRVVANVVEAGPDGVRVGMRVELVWQDFEGFSLPQFRPA